MSDNTASGSLSPAAERILAVAAARPELTAAEIAAETGHIVPTVRDTLAAHEAAATLPDETATTPDTSEAAAMEFDQELLSAAQEEIVEVARAQPTLTNAAIADRTGYRLPLVRDTIAAHGPPATTRQQTGGGAKPTDSASFNDTEQAVLEAALETPEATNRAIATQVGTHVGVVRDIRAADEEIATLPEGYEGETAAADEQAALSETQQAILAVAREQPTATYAEIAETTGARLPLVRDTLETHDPEQPA